MSVVDRIQHYQRSLERCTDNESRTLHCIDKLYKLPVTVQHLKVTGVGRTVNALRKFDGSVGDAAKALVAKWKTMVVDDESSEEEDEACVPDAPEGYSDRSNSPKFDRDNGDDRNSSNYKTCESREKQNRSSDKHESSRHGTKNSSSSENSRPRENELKSSRESSGGGGGEKYKCSKNGIDKRSGKSEGKSETKSEGKGETKSEGKSETKSEGKSETKSEGKSETKSEKKSKSSRDSKDSKSESRNESSKEASTSGRARNKPEEAKKDSSRVSSSSNGGTSKNSSNSHDSHRKRKLDSSSSGRESSKRRKSLESPVDEDYEDPDEVATQVLTRDSDEEAEKILPDTSMDSDSEEETSKTKIKYESPASPPSCERGGSESRHSGKTEKSSKSKSREHSGKSTSSGAGKSRREDERNEKSKSEKTIGEHRKIEKRKDRSPGKESSSKSRSHSSSSSSSKNTASTKEKDEHCESKGKRDKNDCDSKDSKDKFKEPKDKKVKKKKVSKDDSIDCNSGASFAEALGMCTDRPVVRKKPNSVSPSSSVVKTIKTEPGTSSSSSSSSSTSKTVTKVKIEPQASSDPEPLSLLAPNVKLEPLNVDLASTLPEISPNYKPLPAHYMNPVHRKAEESKALSDVIYAKTQRTKVYSGMKSGYTSVPTLCEEAIRVLIENIHELGFTGGIPYDIIKPVLERATPDQLFTVENYNPYLIEDTDQLWQFHCNREFRTKKREEMESWRDMYLRCREEREAKLKALTANIKESIDKSIPVRSTKLAYVDKPPRNVMRQQAKYGTAKISTSSSDLKKQMILSGSSNSATNISVPAPPMSRNKSSSSGVMKKNKAPLMAKALQLIKGRYKR